MKESNLRNRRRVWTGRSAAELIALGLPVTVSSRLAVTGTARSKGLEPPTT
jgi:hypothetical protein